MKTAFLLMAVAGVSNLVSLDPATSSLFMKANTAACMVTMYFQEA